MNNNVFSLVTLLFFISCSSTSPSIEIPEWYKNKVILKEKYPDNILGFGTGKSNKSELAYFKAMQSAQMDLAKHFSGQIINSKKTENSRISSSSIEATIPEHVIIANPTQVQK